MNFSTIADPLPLHTDAEGVVRVGGTRVTLHTVVGAFSDGESAEEVVNDFPTLKLADVYAVFAFYLQHREEVDAYLRQYEAEWERVRRENEARFPQAGLRERLLARRDRA